MDFFLRGIALVPFVAVEDSRSRGGGGNGFAACPATGACPVNAITRDGISDWVGRMKAAGKKPSTIRNAYFLVRQVLAQAVANGRLDTNPPTT